jgi:pilus assembly protein CpaE
MQEIRPSSISVCLIGPDRSKRASLSTAFQRIGVRVSAELEDYPAQAEAEAIAAEDCGAVVIDLDANPQAALTLVEVLCNHNQSITAMLHTSKEDPDLLVNCMRAGARELIRLPVSEEALNDAILRTVRRGARDTKRVAGKTYVFRSAKGGAGASTLAANFSIALARESRSRVALVDLNSELGDLSVLLNVSPEFSILDAVRNPERLDWDFLSGLMVEHKSGVHLLAAPDRFTTLDEWKTDSALEKVFQILQDRFLHIVVDAGRTVNPPVSTLRNAEAIYVVSQIDIPSLRNAQRIASHWTDEMGRRSHMHIVLNRYDARNSGISSADVDRALSFPVQFRVPNDYVRVNNAANTGLSIAEENSPIARTIRQMALTALGKPVQKVVPKTWGLFRFSNS